MKSRHLAASRKPCLYAIALAAGLIVCAPVLADADLENARLAALLRQLDALDRMAAMSAAAAPSGTRYHFDYARLRQDVARIRTGIEDYLSPQRAQPRDPDALTGEYQIERTPSP